MENAHATDENFTVPPQRIQEFQALIDSFCDAGFDKFIVPERSGVSHSSASGSARASIVTGLCFCLHNVDLSGNFRYGSCGPVTIRLLSSGGATRFSFESIQPIDRTHAHSCR